MNCEAGVACFAMMARPAMDTSRLRHLLHRCLIEGTRETAAAGAHEAIRAIKTACTLCSRGPQATFGFYDDRSSGLRLPPMEWPAKRGFSVCLWICISETTTSDRRPTIFHLQSSNGSVIEVSLKPIMGTTRYAIVVRSIGAKGIESEFVTGTEVGLSIVEGSWHFLSLGFAMVQSAFRNLNGDITVGVDDRFLTRPFVPPNLCNGELVEPTVGCARGSFIPGHETGHDSESRRSSAPTRSMGSIHFFSVPLTSAQFECVRRLGWNWDGCTGGDDLGGAERHRMITYNAAAFLDGCVLNVVPVTKERNAADITVNGELARSQGFRGSSPTSIFRLHATLLPNTSRSVTQSPTAVIEALGHPKVLLPLFALLRLHTSSGAEDLDDLFLVFVAVLTSFLAADSEEVRTVRCDEVHRMQLFPILAALLELASGSQLTLGILEVAIGFHSRLVVLLLQQSWAEHVLINFKLWSRSSLEVQRRHVSWMCQVVSDNSSSADQSWKGVLTTARVLEALQASETSASACGEPEDNLRLVRHDLCQLLRIIVERKGVQPEDIVTIVKFALSESRSVDVQSEMLKFLLLFLDNSGRCENGSFTGCTLGSHAILGGFGREKCLLGLLSLTEHQDSDLRMLAFLVFCGVLREAWAMVMREGRTYFTTRSAVTGASASYAGSASNVWCGFNCAADTGEECSSPPVSTAGDYEGDYDYTNGLALATPAVALFADLGLPHLNQATLVRIIYHRLQESDASDHTRSTATVATTRRALGDQQAEVLISLLRGDSQHGKGGDINKSESTPAADQEEENAPAPAPAPEVALLQRLFAHAGTIKVDAATVAADFALLRQRSSRLAKKWGQLVEDSNLAAEAHAVRVKAAWRRVLQSLGTERGPWGRGITVPNSDRGTGSGFLGLEEGEASVAAPDRVEDGRHGVAPDACAYRLDAIENGHQMRHLLRRQRCVASIPSFLDLSEWRPSNSNRGSSSNSTNSTTNGNSDNGVSDKRALTTNDQGNAPPLSSSSHSATIPASDTPLKALPTAFDVLHAGVPSDLFRELAKFHRSTDSYGDAGDDGGEAQREGDEHEFSDSGSECESEDDDDEDGAGAGAVSVDAVSRPGGDLQAKVPHLLHRHPAVMVGVLDPDVDIDVSERGDGGRAPMAGLLSSKIAMELPGTIEVSKGEIRFICESSGEPGSAAPCMYKWSCDMLWAVTQRHHCLQFKAVEFAFSDRRRVLFDLSDEGSARALYDVIMRKVISSSSAHSRQRSRPPLSAVPRRPHEMVQQPTHRPLGGSGPLSPRTQQPLLTLTQAWRTRQISNFEYLMQLNSIAGRTYVDLAQFPVLPWVLADYTSKRLDLKDPKSYRDLRYPMGAQTARQRESCDARYQEGKANYESSPEDGMKPFHHGSHYSCFGFVVWYLMRLEPFTSLHIKLQDGTFDKPDRLFNSIESAWNSCTENSSDVKELIPEFFCCPEMFENVNALDMGVTQSGMAVGAVQLPPWARNAQDFTAINREALESEYVSENLHYWIDLIFGFKQRPPMLSGGKEDAVDARNCFVHLTYEGAVDLAELKRTDPHLYHCTVQQILCYGQTPIQLFRQPHPQRKPIEESEVVWPIASSVLGADTIPRQSGRSPLEKPSSIRGAGSAAVSAAAVRGLVHLCDVERLVVVDAEGDVGLHTLTVRSVEESPPFVFKLDPACSLAESAKSTRMTGALVAAKTLSSFLLKQIARQRSSSSTSSSGTSQHHRSSNNSMHFGAVHPMAGTSENRSRYENDERAIDSAKKGHSTASPTTTTSTSVKDDVDPTTSAATTTSATSAASVPATGTDTPPATTVTPAPAPASTPVTAAAPINSQEQIEGPLSYSLPLPYAVVDTASDAVKLLVTAGHCDRSIRVKPLLLDGTASSRSQRATLPAAARGDCLHHHQDVVTCMATTSDRGQHWLISGAGSMDCTVAVWQVKGLSILPRPAHVFRAHDGAVNCVAAHAASNVVVSGSDDGTVVVHALRDGTYLHSIAMGIGRRAWDKPMVDTLTSTSTSTATAMGGTAGYSAVCWKPRRVHMLCISPQEACVLAYSADGDVVCTYTFNGRWLASRAVHERLYAMILSEDGKVVLTGGTRCLVVLRWVTSLKLADNGTRRGMPAVIDGGDGEGGRFAATICSMVLTQRERLLLVGTAAGDVRMLACDTEYLNKRIYQTLKSTGFVR